MHKTTILCQFGLFFVTSLLTHISINSQPFLVGIVSLLHPVGGLGLFLQGFLIARAGVFLGILIIKMYSLTARISLLCSNGLDGLLIQTNPVILGSIIFLALASGEVSMFLPCEFEAIVLGASERGELCLCVVLVFDGHISFRVIFIFLLGTNFGNL